MTAPEAAHEAGDVVLSARVVDEVRATLARGREEAHDALMAAALPEDVEDALDSIDSRLAYALALLGRRLEAAG